MYVLCTLMHFHNLRLDVNLFHLIKFYDLVTDIQPFGALQLSCAENTVADLQSLIVFLLDLP